MVGVAERVWGVAVGVAQSGEGRAVHTVAEPAVKLWSQCGAASQLSTGRTPGRGSQTGVRQII